MHRPGFSCGSAVRVARTQHVSKCRVKTVACTHPPLLPRCARRPRACGTLQSFAPLAPHLPGGRCDALLIAWGEFAGLTQCPGLAMSRSNRAASGLPAQSNCWRDAPGTAEASEPRLRLERQAHGIPQALGFSLCAISRPKLPGRCARLCSCCWLISIIYGLTGGGRKKAGCSRVTGVSR